MTEHVSVVVPCRDHGHLLGDALDSIAEQGLTNVEVLVVDDASSDETVAIAIAGGARVVPSRGRGAAAARNTGADATSGEIIAFLDADDLWPHDSLQRRMAALAGNDAAYGGVEEFVDDDLEGPSPEPRIVGPTRIAGSVLVTRSAWSVVGEMNENLSAGEFVDWMGRFDVAGLRAAAVDEIVLRRRIHAANTTRQAGSAVAAGLLEVARLQRHRLQR